MNRFWVSTNDSMIKAGNVRGICLHISFINDCVPAEVVSELHQKEKNITLYVKDLILFVKAYFFKKRSMGDFTRLNLSSLVRDAVSIWVVNASPQLSLLRQQRAYFVFHRKLKLRIFISLGKHIELRTVIIRPYNCLYSL